MSATGYVEIYAPDHPRAHGKGYVFEHILVAERALGRTVQRPAQIHHVDGNKTNNDPANLVICEGRAYHKLLHIRTEAFEATGNADARKCRWCQKWDRQEDISVNCQNSPYHRSCEAARAVRWRAEQKAKRFPYDAPKWRLEGASWYDVIPEFDEVAGSRRTGAE